MEAEIRCALMRFVGCTLCLLFLSLAALSGARQAFVSQLDERQARNSAARR